MKRMFLFFCVPLIFLSCTGNDDQQKPQSSPLSAQLQQLKQDISSYPDSLLLVEKLIQYYREEGAYDSALAVTDKALRKAPELARLWNIKATLHFENEDTLHAITSFEKAVEIYPTPQYIMSLGALYAQTKNRKALTMADALLFADKVKNAKDADFIKGLYYSYSGDKKKAIALFDSCISMDYTFMFAYKAKAIALYDGQKYAEAIKVLERAVTIQNNFDEGYYWIGNCYKKLDKKEEAIQNYHMALMYDKDFIEARDSLKTLE